jgi:hypothetical protein
LGGFGFEFERNDQGRLLARTADGVGPDPRLPRRTHERNLALARERPLVYLPSHDPESASRLANRSVLEV